MKTFNVVVRAVVDAVYPVRAESQVEAENIALNKFNVQHPMNFMPEVTAIQDGETFEPLEVVGRRGHA